MKNNFLTILFFLFIFSSATAQVEQLVKLDTGSGELHGTLLLPQGMSADCPVVFIIAGSGPTDRDGNNVMMKNNSLKMLAEGLSGNGIASLRYDKRGVAASRGAAVKEIDLRFEDYIEDAVKWLEYLKNDERFGKIVVLGHSEGSLIGMVASQKAEADKFVSIAGAGEPAGVIMEKQLKAQPPALYNMAVPILNKLEKGELVEGVPPMLNKLFRPSVQPYLVSWFKYDPVLEIEKLNIPVLIVQGTTDIQVSIENADKLVGAVPKGEKLIVDGMNHIFKEAPLDRQMNLKTYMNSDLPIHHELIGSMVDFILRK